MEQIKDNNEIDIIGLVKKVLSEWKILCISIICFSLVGLIVALNTQKRYTTTVILAPELSGGGSLPEGLSNIASMVGVNLGNSAGSGIDAIYPQIYPDVLTSSNFIINLFDIQVKQKEDSISKSYYQHINTDNLIPFWSYPGIYVRKIFEDKNKAKETKKLNPFMLTKQQDNTLNAIRSNISCIVDKNTNVISISVTDNDPVVSATMADTIQHLLQQYIILYRTQKARNDVEYTKKLYKEAKKQYVKAQEIYSSYSDSNVDVILESYKAKRDELENEMQLKYNMYNQIAQQLQAVQAKVQERTPAFSTIQEASVPLKASSTPRSFIVLIYAFLGIFCDVLWVLFIKDKFKKNK